MANNPNQPAAADKPHTRSIGTQKETMVLRFLEERGYRELARNFSWRGGEIDLVLSGPDGMLVFVEVRSASTESAYLRYSISAAKRRRLMATAQVFLRRHCEFRRRPFRFDVIWVEGEKTEHWRNVELGN